MGKENTLQIVGRDKEGFLNKMQEFMQEKETKKQGKQGRMANLELLRCIAMMMVVVLHFLGKGRILSELTEPMLGAYEVAAWILEVLCIVAVNAYMLISGFFLSASSFRLSRLCKLYLQLWLYSVGVGALGILTGIFPLEQVTVHDLLTLIFPVSMGHYWFLTAYVYMYLFLPFIGAVVQKMSKKQMQLALGMLLFFFSVLKSVLPIRLEMDGQGYDCIWYLCVFLTAAYIRRFGMKLISNRRRSVCLYLAAASLIFAVTMGLHLWYLRTGSMGRMIKIALEYNHVLTFVASLGLFGIFLHSKVSESFARVVNRIAPYTLGVYLLHENLTFRYAWQNWFGANRIESVGGLLLGTGCAVAAVFTAGILLDILRAWMMRKLHVLLNKTKIYQSCMTVLEKGNR